MADKIEFLKSIPYFTGLGQDKLEAISRYIFEKKLERGDMVFLEGSSAEALYFVVEGVVKVFKTSAEGKEQILALVRPGETFNDVPMLDDGPTPASAQTMSPVRLYGIQKADFRLILRQYPDLTMNMLRAMAKRTRYLMTLVEDLSFRDVVSRVGRLLLENAGRSSQPGPRLTQRDMAAMVGTAREVVSRSLKYLEEDGLIKMQQHRIIIADKNRLERLIGINSINL
jgi:CRP/FNR family transcriptional regulator